MAFTPEEIGEIIEQFMETVGTRQYIGARYVPIFGRKGETSIEWDNTAPYEPLTIVLYQGNSYTSRQYVPSGIDITKLDFWAPTGTYNAQVAAYVAQVQQFDGRISQNTNDIEALEDAVGDLQESNVHLYAFPGDGSAIVITDGTTNILIDTAVNTAATTLKNWIQSELGISTFNVCILSHFHPDHAGGFSGLHELFDNTTQFFIQMPCTTTNGEYSIYQTWHNAMLNSIASYSFNSPIVPEQDSVYRVRNTYSHTHYTTNHPAPVRCQQNGKHQQVPVFQQDQHIFQQFRSPRHYCRTMRLSQSPPQAT